MKGRGGYRLRAFTLIELILVIALLALVLSITVSQMDWLIPKYRLRAAAREVGETMSQARYRALGTSKDVYVTYDLSKGKYWLLVAFPIEEPGKVDPTQPPSFESKGFEYQGVYPKTLPEDVQFKDVVFGKGQQGDSGVVRVRVSPFGMADHHIVNLRNESGAEIAVRLNGFTGALRFYDQYQGPEEVLKDEGH